MPDGDKDWPSCTPEHVSHLSRSASPDPATYPPVPSAAGGAGSPEGSVGHDRRRAAHLYRLERHAVGRHQRGGAHGGVQAAHQGPQGPAQGGACLGCGRDEELARGKAEEGLCGGSSSCNAVPAGAHTSATYSPAGAVLRRVPPAGGARQGDAAVAAAGAGPAPPGHARPPLAHADEGGCGEAGSGLAAVLACLHVSS